jgi:sulfite exporter TauE/SafE
MSQAFPLGMLWGWLPCGLVSALASALTAGSAERGALMMLAFGLGTLPNLLRRPGAGPPERIRPPSGRAYHLGLLVLGFGLYGFFGLARLSGWL